MDSYDSLRGLSRTHLGVIAIGKIEIQLCGLAEQSSARGAPVAIDHLLLHRILDEVALVLGCVVALRQEFRGLLRSAVRAAHLAQLHRGRRASHHYAAIHDRAGAGPGAY